MHGNFLHDRGLFASSLAVLLFLLCDRLRLALCLTDLYGDQVSAAYMDGVAAPIIAKAMGMEMRPAVATSRTGIVPKGFYSEEEEEEQTPEDWAPLEFQPRRLNDKYYTFQPNLDRPPNYGKGPVYRPVKKFPRLLPPWPFGLLVRDPIRPFPTNTILIVSPILLIPFAPFGVFELRLPLGFNLNYIIERLNGVSNGRRSLDVGRSLYSTPDMDQMDFYGLVEGLLTDTFALDGRQCVQRLICDLAQDPIRDRSLMGEILHMLIEPRLGSAKVSDDFVEAELRGHKYGGCRSAYPNCPFSIANLIGVKWDTQSAPRR